MEVITVVTHDGTFHADDVFAMAMLNLHYGERIRLLRTRKNPSIAEADIVFDVGGCYNPELGRFDHHQVNPPIRPNGEPYSSAGLVWKQYGRDIIQALIPEANEIEAVLAWLKIHDTLIRDIDLIDNGAMKSSPGHIAALIESMNATYLEQDIDNDTLFQQAAAYAEIFLRRAAAGAFACNKAGKIVVDAAICSVDPRVLVLDQRVPYEDTIFDLKMNDILYVVYPKDDYWMLSVVPPEKGSFAQRKPLPRMWAGLRDKAFAKRSGVEDAIFCHNGRFCCAARSKDGILALAEIAVNSRKKN
jgi:uncharacterized UPF0160 family protein